MPDHAGEPASPTRFTEQHDPPDQHYTCTNQHKPVWTSMESMLVNAGFF